MNIGEQIILLRKSKKISQGTMAEALDITRPYYNKLEKNDGQFTKKMLSKIGEVFGKKLLIIYIDEL